MPTTTAPVPDSPVSPDAIFSNARLARIYDVRDPDRSDLEAYLAMIGEVGASSLLDIGCGTGTFALAAAATGVQVIGVDPAGASLDVACAKPGADAVTWLHGTAPDAVETCVARGGVELVTMTGNVAQVFTTDEGWSEAVAAAHAALRPGGHFVFETRDPDKRWWQHWTTSATHEVVDLPDEGRVEGWTDVTEVTELGGGEVMVTFTSPTIFHSDGERIESTSTLRFRTRAALTSSLLDAGFVVDEVRDAPDRPGLEFVFVARKA